MTTIDQLARAAADEVSEGDVVGLGTGRAASRAIRAIGEKAREGGYTLRGVPTSRASATLATEMGIEVIDLARAEGIDVLLDGVDELAPGLILLKGQGGAMTREKVVAWAARRRVYLMQRSKIVDRLGETFGVPVEVLASAASATRAILETRGVLGAWRADQDGADVLTDDGNPILDCPIGEDADVRTVGALIDTTPGVVGHGLFLVEADRVIIEDGAGELEFRDR